MRIVDRCSVFATWWDVPENVTAYIIHILKARKIVYPMSIVDFYHDTFNG